MRSLLTVLGITIGIAVTKGVFAIGRLHNARSSSNWVNLGPNLLGTERRRLNTRGLTIDVVTE
jgi:ABC-type antimicrobial peptide transport system permease subunit